MREQTTMPYDMNRNDSLYGTIVSANSYGIKIRLDMDDYRITDEVLAFAHSQGKIGQRVLTSISYFNKKHNNFAATIDSYLSVPATQAVITKETISAVMNVA